MKKLLLLITLSAGLMIPYSAASEDLTLPYPEFKPATPAFASSINANFEALRTGVNGNTRKISANRDNISINTGNIESNSSSITSVKSELASHGHSPGDIAPQGSGSGLDADLLDGSDSEDFAGAVHGHEPGDILSQGAGSGLDADKLDGSDSADFAGAVHGHAPSDLTSQGSGSGLDADMLDGKDSIDFAAAGHDHDSRYTLTGHTHPSDDITGKINADTFENMNASDFARSVHSHTDYALTDHNHTSDYAALDHNHEAMAGDIEGLKDRMTDVENYGDLSSVLDEITALHRTIDQLKLKITELEGQLKSVSQ